MSDNNNKHQSPFGESHAPSIRKSIYGNRNLMSQTDTTPIITGNFNQFTIPTTQPPAATSSNNTDTDKK